MIDSILTSRLDMLEQNLERVMDSKSLKSSMQLQRFEVPAEFWLGLDATIGRQIKNHFEELRQIRELLAEAEQEKDTAVAKGCIQQAWHRYTEVYQQSQETFDECLTIIGGLTFRDQDLDKEYICLIADELIRDCSRQSTSRPWEPLTVPALLEVTGKTLARIIAGKTLARIIRLRFQEWTIWTLPFTAHEFGHVVIIETELKGFIDEEVECLVKRDSDFQRLQNEAADEQVRRYVTDRAKRRARFHLNEFLADAFATYTMGPAYACAAILLRFNPSAAYTDENDEHPADAKRAYVVFSMLKYMNNQAGRLSSPYGGVIKYLEEEWKDTLDRAGPSGTLSAQDKQYLDDFVRRIPGKFYFALIPAALYPLTGGEGWAVAQNWMNTWRDQLEKGDSLSISSVSRTHKLRDALNAAWFCRISIDKPDRVKEIAEAARGLCAAIIEKQREPLEPKPSQLQPPALRNK